jgi:hypothetical protein
MTDRETLAARIEAATGPDRELDADIAVFVDGGEIVWLTANGTMEQYPARKYQSRNHVGGFGKSPVPAYTASLDAAMMLADNLEDAAVTVTRYATGKGLAQIDFPNGRQVFGNAATPALALAAAAIRAGGV